MMSTAPSNIKLSLADSMAQIQGSPPVFAMHGAREILALTAGAVHIEQQTRALEDAVARNPGLAFDLAKALIESVCKTILRDRGQAVSDEDDLPKLFGNTLGQLRVLPEAHTGDRETGRSIRKTTGALYAVVQGICELRNKQGFASHGKVAETQPLETVQAELVARSADAVVSFLFKAHRSYAVPAARPKRVEYADNEGFNAFVDESHEPINIFTLSYRPSEVLYSVDYQAYVESLNSYLSEQADEASAAGSPRVPA
jgi:hypothetical protein